MDMDEILASVDKNLSETPNVEPEAPKDASSEAPKAEEGKTAVEATSVPADESEKENGGEEKPSEVAEVKDDKPSPETEPRKEQRAYHRPQDPLKQARYTAQKWQRKYKRLKSEFDAKMADYQRYQGLDAAKFENDEDRQSYLAWKASRQQNLQDLSDQMRSIAQSYREEQLERENEEFNNKVERIYGANAEQFMDLEDQWGDTFEAACNAYDKTNVVRDFIKRSPLGPAIKNVIYGDGELQHDLFERSSGNPMIDASDRVNLLRNVERMVRNYLTGGNQTQAPKAAQAPSAKAAAPRPTAKKLPHLPPRKAPDAGIPAGVTGNLTKTDVGGEPVTNDAEIAKVYHSVFG